MSLDKSPAYDTFLEELEKRSRSARLMSIALTVIPVVIAVVFLLITVRQIQQAQARLAETELDLREKKKEAEDTQRRIEELNESLAVLNKTVQALPQPTFQKALNNIEDKPRLTEGVPAQNENIHNILPTPLSEKELKLSVEYSYYGGEGARTVVMVATALQSNGQQVPGTSYGAAVVKPVVKPGTGAVTVTIEKTGNSDFYTSTKLKVCMQVAGGKNIACKSLDYSKEWK